MLYRTRRSRRRTRSKQSRTLLRRWRRTTRRCCRWFASGSAASTRATTPRTASARSSTCCSSGAHVARLFHARIHSADMSLCLAALHVGSLAASMRNCTMSNSYSCVLAQARREPQARTGQAREAQGPAHRANPSRPVQGCTCSYLLLLILILLLALASTLLYCWPAYFSLTSPTSLTILYAHLFSSGFHHSANIAHILDLVTFLPEGFMK